MPSEKLRQAIDQLHAELDSAAPMDAADRAQLRDVLTEIRDALDPDANRPAGLLDRLRHSVEGLEADHPKVTATVLEMIATLRHMGF